MSSSFSFSSIAHSYSSLDSYTWGSVVLTLTTYATTFDFKYLNRTVTMHNPGVSFIATFPITSNSALAPISTWFGEGAIQVYATFASNSDELTIGSELDFAWNWTDRVAVTAARLYFQISSAELSIYVSATLSVINKADGSVVPFTGRLGFDFTSQSISAGFSMDAEWQKPLGLRGVSLLQSTLDGAINIQTGVPTAFDVASGLSIGCNERRFGGTSAVKLDLLSSQSDFFGGNMSNVDLPTCVQDLTLNKLPAGFVETAFAITMDEVSADFTPSTVPITFNGVTYQPGFHMRCTNFNLYNYIKGSAELSVEPETGVVAVVNTAPFSFGSVDGTPLLAVGGAGSSRDLVFNIQLVKDQPAVMDLEASIQVWKFLDVAAVVNISDSGWMVSFNASQLDNMLDVGFTLTSQGPVSAPTDFSISGFAHNSFEDWLSTQGVEYIANLSSAIESRLSEDKATVDAWFNTGGGHEALQTVDSEIDTLEGDILNLLSGAQKELASAQQALAAAQQSNHKLSSQISSEQSNIQSCKWYDAGCHAHNIWTDTKITALRAEQLIREAAVTVAQDLVAELQRTVSASQDAAVTADLQAKYVAQATLNVTHLLSDAALTASQNLTATLSTLLEYTASKAATAFNPQEVTFSGSLSTVQHSGALSCRIKGIFFGATLDHTFSTSIGNTTSILDEVYKLMQSKWITGGVTSDSSSSSSGSSGISSTPFDRCEAFATCGACSGTAEVDGTRCGWCQYTGSQGLCSSGSASNPACEDWRFGTCDAPPPPPPPPRACPVGLQSETCSGYGTCDTNTYTCNCGTGRNGVACEFNCESTTIANPQKDGHPVDKCQYNAGQSWTNCGSTSWTAGQICQQQVGSASKAISWDEGGCVSTATYMAGGTCSTHWYNFGDCQCHNIVNVVCSNPASYCS